MTAQPKTHVTAPEYFVRDQQSAEKLEFYAGIVVAQAGSTARHNLIVSNLIGHLYPQVRQQGCRIFPGDMRVQAVDQRVYTYPDITIVCGPPQYADPSEMTLINPMVIIEILSPSTETRDRTEKFVYYRSIDSLQEYILIAQHMPYVQRYTRQTPHFWYVHLTDDLAAQVEFEAIGCALPMQAIYDGITF
jgi:Uma2 family endonuclease